MTKIWICDNDPDVAGQLRQSVTDCFPGECAVELCCTAEAFQERLAQGNPDIVLLDIVLGDENGIELAKKHFPRESGVAVIFVTGYLEYCTDVYETEHVYFLPKPVQPEKLRRALQTALRAHDEAPCSFTVRTDGALRRIDVRDVYCVESFYRKLRIRMLDDVVECYGSITTLPQEVLGRMIHCHKSFLVNPEHVRTMDRQTFLLTNGHTIPISRNRYAASREAFLAHCSRHIDV